MSSSVTGGSLGLRRKSPLNIISLMISASVLYCCTTFSMALVFLTFFFLVVGSFFWLSDAELAVSGFLGGTKLINGGGTTP